MSALWAVLVVAQGVAAAVLLARLIRGRRRPRPVEPAGDALPTTPTTIIVATLNEAARIEPLLAGVELQGDPVMEVLVVDSQSTDGTRRLVAAAATDDPRVRLISDDPLPDGWIGKAWALECARHRAQGTWLLGLDADVIPRPGMAAAAVAAAERGGFDLVSFSPRFIGQTAAERWLHPALLATLVYRFGAGTEARADRVLANGQCFLVKRAVLAAHGGYEPVRGSFCEDVSLARHLARNGARVTFLDGSRLFDVRSYRSAREMWREWGRSIDLKDASTTGQQARDVAFLALVQGVPVPFVIAAAAGAPLPAALVLLNAALVAARVLLGVAMAPSYAVRGVAYWLSPLADPLAVVRVVISSLRRPRVWRGRGYGKSE